MLFLQRMMIIIPREVRSLLGVRSHFGVVSGVNFASTLYFRYATSSIITYILPLACQCNGHSSCVNTSICEDCQNNTDGSHCESCQAGFWGDSHNGGICESE